MRAVLKLYMRPNTSASSPPPRGLSGSGVVYVQFTVTALGYYLGKMTPTFERPCAAR